MRIQLTLAATCILATTALAQTTTAAPPEVPAWAMNKDGRITHPHDEHATPPSPQPPGLYVAMGDSITNGTGVKQSCRAFPTHPVDIEEYCPDGTSYAILTAKALRKAGVAGSFMNLGIGGAHVERIIADELPYLPANATLVTVYIGTNDSRVVRKLDLPYTKAASDFEQTFDNLLDLIHARAPQARIVLVNFPNQKYMAEPNRFTDEILARFDTNSQILDKFLDDHFPKYAVADTVCNPASYDPALRYENGVHPNEAGAAILAQTLTATILAKSPQAPPKTCQWYDETKAKSLANPAP